MIHGLDTTFLVAAEIQEHADHQAAQAKLAALFQGGDQLSLTPWVIGEFVRVVTDAKRFQVPLDMPTAIRRSEAWWNVADAWHNMSPRHGQGDGVS